jgi:hypothetical protein
MALFFSFAARQMHGLLGLFAIKVLGLEAFSSINLLLEKS